MAQVCNLWEPLEEEEWEERLVETLAPPLRVATEGPKSAKQRATISK